MPTNSEQVFFFFLYFITHISENSFRASLISKNKSNEREKGVHIFQTYIVKGHLYKQEWIKKRGST